MFTLSVFFIAHRDPPTPAGATLLVTSMDTHMHTRDIILHLVRAYYTRTGGWMGFINEGVHTSLFFGVTFLKLVSRVVLREEESGSYARGM